MLRNRIEDTGQGAVAASPAEPAEVSLIGGIAARDLRAFEVLYRAYHTRLTRFLERLTRRALVEEVLSALARALDDLTPEHRAVIELTYFHGIGYREIAQIVDCPVDTVKTRLFHARRQLRALLKGELGDWL